MSRYTEDTLKMALEAAHVRELPKMQDFRSGMRWIRGIALVEKRNAPRGYVLVSRAGNGVVRVTRDFGVMSPIKAIVNVYPYLYLDEARFLRGMTAEKRHFLLKQYCGSEKAVSSLSEAEKEAVLVDFAIKRQLASEEVDRLQDRMSSEADFGLQTDLVRDGELQFETIADRASVEEARRVRKSKKEK